MKQLENLVLYLCLHKRLDERVNASRILSKQDLFKLLGVTFHIPKVLNRIILKELEYMKIIKDLGQCKNYNVYVNRLKLDPIEKTTKLCRMWDIF